MRLFVDEMLGRLARTLRLLGHDTEYARGMDDTAILHQARSEERLIVTRDIELASRASKDPGSILIQSRTLKEQMRELEYAMGDALHAPDPLSRCTVCNGRLERMPAMLVGGSERADDRAATPQPHIPTGRLLWRCVSCRKIYWEGTHVRDIRRRFGIGSRGVL
ncbi:MAG: DUF5615 family PIN-like protein [Thermoplasmatota archaeon]